MFDFNINWSSGPLPTWFYSLSCYAMSHWICLTEQVTSTVHYSRWSVISKHPDEGLYSIYQMHLHIMDLLCMAYSMHMMCILNKDIYWFCLQCIVLCCYEQLFAYLQLIISLHLNLALHISISLSISMSTTSQKFGPRLK